MGSRFIIKPGGQDGEYMQKEILISIDNSTLVIPAMDAWDAAQKISETDHKIMARLLELHEGKVWLDHNSWIIYRLRVKSWIKEAVKKDSPPQKINNYSLSNPKINKVVLLDDESMCTDTIARKIAPTMLAPSAILYSGTNDADFFKNFHQIAMLRSTLKTELPRIDKWILDHRYSCCPTLDEYIYACRISVRALQSWTDCVLERHTGSTFYSFATSSYYTQEKLPEGKKCQFDPENRHCQCSSKEMILLMGPTPSNWDLENSFSGTPRSSHQEKRPLSSTVRKSFNLG
jgi:hypothetical protein